MSLPPTKERLLDWVNEQQQLDPVGALVLLKLAHYADAEGCTWALVEVLSKFSRRGVRTVQYRLRDLEEEGLIRRTGRKHRLPNSTRDVPIYQLAPALFEVARMGANSAPIAGEGVQKTGGDGCNCLHPHKETDETDDSSHELSGRARAAELGFEEGDAAFPQSGRAKTDYPKARQAWISVCAEVEPDALVAAVRRYAAEDPMLRKGDYGAPGLEKWLSAERWRAWVEPGCGLTAGAERGVAAPRRAVFGGPAALRADFLASFGEGLTASYLDGCGWAGEGRVLLARTGTALAWLQSTARWWLRKHGLSAARITDRSTTGEAR